MKIVIDIPKESYDFAKECKHNGTSKYNWCLSHNDVVFMVANGTPISDNATNGDIIKAMFNILDSEIDEGLSKYNLHLHKNKSAKRRFTRPFKRTNNFQQRLVECTIQGRN